MEEDALEDWGRVHTPLTAWKIILQPVILDLLVVFHKLCQSRKGDAQPLEQPQQE